MRTFSPSWVGWQAAHAVELARALRIQLLEMTRRLNWLERQINSLERRNITGTTLGHVPCGGSGRAATRRSRGTGSHRTVSPALTCVKRMRAATHVASLEALLPSAGRR